MKNILVVCGAGASSTFLAHRMRTAARARGFEATVKAASQAALDSRLPGVHVLLVGPHLASDLAALTEVASAYEVPVALLPETVFGPDGENDALSLAIETMPDTDLAHFPVPAPAWTPASPSPLTPGELPMTERTAQIASSHGLHARPASLFTQAVAKSGVKVTIAKPEGKPVNAASILGVISLGIESGDTVTLAAEGDDSAVVLDELAAMLERDLDAE